MPYLGMLQAIGSSGQQQNGRAAGGGQQISTDGTRVVIPHQKCSDEKQTQEEERACRRPARARTHARAQDVQ
jgi:hypothetical protein